MIIRNIFASLVFVLACFLTTNTALATTDYNFLKVDHIANGFEKIQEKFTLFTKFSKNDQASYRQFLAEKRLSELKYVIDSNQIDSIEEVASRYETYIGSLTNFIIENKINSQKESLLKMYSQHQTILEEFSKKFEHGSGWWFVIQHDININKISAERVSSLK